MDRGLRGTGTERYRNPSTSQYSSSEYGSRSYEHSQQHRSRGRGSGNSTGWSGDRSYVTQKEYERYSSSEGGSKRKYEDSGQHKKSYDHHLYDQSSPRKYHRSESSHSFEGRSNHHHHNHPHHRSQYEQSSSSNRSRYLDNGRQSSHNNDSYQSQRRFNENRRYQRGGSGSSGGRGVGGYISSRGRARGRGARNQGAALHQNPQSKDHHSEKTEDSSSPNRLSIAEEFACASDVDPSVSPSRQPTEDNLEDATSDKVVGTHSGSDKSTREENDADKGVSAEKEPISADDTIKTDESKTEESAKKSESTEQSPKRKTSSKEAPEHFIRLQCPHCNQRSITFREYIVHLSSQRHANSLEKVSQQHRMSLAKLRTRQRKEQLQIEAQSSRSHNSRMNFCAICKLCHSESRPNHETTELHKIIKNFLMPYCPICRVNFKSRMLYEKHVATLTHIKNKVNMEKSYERRREEERKYDRNGLDKDELVLDLENFMTLDAVGSVDGDADNGLSLEENAIGQECVKKVEAFFCEVCQRYLSRVEPLEKGLEFHCRTRSHHRAFEEHQNGHKAEKTNDQTEMEEAQQKEAEMRSVLVEAEKDIGELCDLIGDDEQAPEDDEDQNVEEPVENVEEQDENMSNQERFEGTQTNEDK